MVIYAIETHFEGNPRLCLFSFRHMRRSYDNVFLCFAF